VKDNREFKVYKIEDGTVIDHIPSPKGMLVFKMLSCENEGIVSIGLNFDSKKGGKKDLLKYEKKFLCKEETDKIAVIAPEATINIIKDGEVLEKRYIEMPSEIKGILKCTNPNCITNHEKITTYFKVVDQKPVRVMCQYCERILEVNANMIPNIK